MRVYVNERFELRLISVIVKQIEFAMLRIIL